MEDKKKEKEFIKNSSLFAAEYICCGFSGKAEALWLKLKPQYLAGIKDLVENDPPKVDRALVYFGRDILDMARVKQTACTPSSDSLNLLVMMTGMTKTGACLTHSQMTRMNMLTSHSAVL